MLKLIICDYSRITTYLIDKEYKLDDFYIFLNDGIYYLKCKNNTSFIDGTLIKKIENTHYKIIKEDIFYEISIYTYLNIANEIFTKYIQKELLISDFYKANIITYDKNLKGCYIFIKNGLIVSNYDNIYVNSKKYHGQFLKNNDLIEILGLKIIYNDKFFVINNFLNDIKICELDLKRIVYDDYKSEKYILNHKYINTVQKPELKYQIYLDEYHQNEQNNSFVISFLQGLLMSLGMIAIGVINIYLGINNNRNQLELLPMIIMPSIMVITTLFFPIINKIYQKRKNINKEKNIRDKNEIKLIELTRDIKKDLEQLKIYGEYFEFNKTKLNVKLKEHNIYQRFESDNDYLYLHLGYGQIETNINIDLLKGNSDDINVKRINEIKNKFRYIDSLITVNLNKYFYITVKTNIKDYEYYLLAILLELEINHFDLKVTLLIDKELLFKYNFIKENHMLNNGDYRRIYFEEKDLYTIDEDILIITTKHLSLDYKTKSYRIMHFVYNDSISKSSDLIININDDNSFLEDKDKKIYFKTKKEKYHFENIYNELIKYDIKTSKKIISHNTLYDYYPKKLDLKKIYNKNKHAMNVLFGIKDDYKPLIFDISDKGIGPHAVISGGTGSGKSVHILSLIFSLVTNFSAKDINITLIDYKGSGLAQSLSYKGKILPHITLSLTNIDQYFFNRSIISLKKECERREKLFAKLANITKTSIMCLDDYKSFYKEEYLLDYLPNQIIIIDEFAELKKEKPDFMKDIISIARIGRSLGINLILSTQKPSGSIDQEIWSNITYRIVLKAQNDSDSKEMIGNNLATKIELPGEFYLMYNRELNHAYTLNSRSYIDPKNESFVAVLNEKKEIIKKVEYICNDKTRQLEEYIKQIIDYHEYNNIKTKSIYLDILKNNTQTQLINKYNYNLEYGEILLGEFDDYKELKSGLLIHNLNNNPLVLFVYKDILKRDKVVELIISSLLLKQIPNFIYICDIKNNKNYEINGIEYISYLQVDDIIYIINRILAEDLNIFLLIDDLELLLQDENIKTIFEKMLVSLFKLKLKLIVFIRNIYALNHKYRNQFYKYQIDYLSKEETMIIFEKYNEHSEENCYLNNEYRLVGFKLPNIDFDIKYCINKKIVERIPKTIEINHKKEMINLGYELSNRKPYYIEKNKIFLCTSYYLEILNKYKNVLNNPDNINFILYHNLKIDELYDGIIWVGPNISSQYLFITNLKDDLKVNEIYLYINGKRGVKIRYE